MSGTTVSNGQTLVVSSAVSGVNVQSGGSLRVVSGGQVTSSHVSAGGTEVVLSGGTDVDGVLLGTGTLVVSNGGTAIDTNDAAGGTLLVSSGGTEIVSAGHTVYNAQVLSGGTAVVLSGGNAYAPQVRSGGTLVISAGGVANSVALSSGGTITERAGGSINSIVVSSGATLGVTSGASARNVTLSGGTLVVSSGAVVSGAVARPGSLEIVSAGGTLSASTINSGATETVLSGGTDIGSLVSAGSTLIVSSGGTAIGTKQTAGGRILVSAGGAEIVPAGTTVYSATVLSGGTETVSSGGSVNGTVISGGELVLRNGAQAGGSLSFAGPGGRLAIDAATPSTAPISGFVSGDTIDLTAVPYVAGGTATLLAGNQLRVSEGARSVSLKLDQRQSFAGRSFALAPDAGSGTNVTLSAAPCYRAGTRIATPDGERAVEVLQPGDLVLTENGAAEPVRWVGSRIVDANAHPAPEAVLPIRIRRDAIGPGRPQRDLWVSPDHALHIDGMLIAARLLVNGVSIATDEAVRQPRYLHVELARHAILLAEGLPAESYLDTGNRGVFANASGPLVLHPDLSRLDRGAGSCAPFVTDPALVAPIWRRIAEVAGTDAPVEEGGDAVPLLEADGRLVRPVSSGRRHVFALPRGLGAVRVRSAAFRPSDSQPWLDDRRLLGVRVTRITAQTNQGSEAIPLDGPALGQGWWAVELTPGCHPTRWSDGAAELALPEDALVLTLELAPRREAPPARVA